jgi:hypothetical protein
MSGKTKEALVGMRSTNQFQPLKNNSGVATIAIVVAVATAMLAYTSFTATSYVMMMTESKRQSRTLIGYEVMKQFAQTMQLARQRHHDHVVIAGNPDCAGEPSGATVTIGNFCLPANGFCIDHPLDPNRTVADSEICFQAEIPASNVTSGRFAELRQVQKQKGLLAEMKQTIQNVNHQFGRKAFYAAKRVLAEAPVAYATRSQDILPDTGSLTAPRHQFDIAANETCLAASDSPTNICMICDEAAVAAGVAGDRPRPACINLYVCPKNLLGHGNCADPATTPHDWFIQTVAITAPVVRVP